MYSCKQGCVQEVNSTAFIELLLAAGRALGPVIRQFSTECGSMQATLHTSMPLAVSEDCTAMAHMILFLIVLSLQLTSPSSSGCATLFSMQKSLGQEHLISKEG